MENGEEKKRAYYNTFASGAVQMVVLLVDGRRDVPVGQERFGALPLTVRKRHVAPRYHQVCNRAHALWC